VSRSADPRHQVTLVPAAGKGRSARAGAPRGRIACEGGQEQLGRIEATIRTEGRTASSSLSHLNTAIHEEPNHVARASGRAGVREGAQGRNDEVLAEPE
jgi:hypothetical protein